MQTEVILPRVVDGKAAGSVAARNGELASISADRRVLRLSAMALVIGAIGSAAADVLTWLMAAITNLAFYHRLSVAPALPGTAPG